MPKSQKRMTIPHPLQSSSLTRLRAPVRYALGVHTNTQLAADTSDMAGLWLRAVSCSTNPIT